MPVTHSTKLCQGSKTCMFTDLHSKSTILLSVSSLLRTFLFEKQYQSTLAQHSVSSTHE